jgi:Retrotransposon gag protein
MITVKRDSKNKVIKIKSGSLTDEILDSKRETRSSASGTKFSFEDKPHSSKERSPSDSKVDKRNSIPSSKIASTVEQPSQLPASQQQIVQALPVIPVDKTLPEPEDDMADGVSVPLFFGNVGDDVTIWLNCLKDFIQFKTIVADKQLSLFKLRLAGPAQAWMTSLPDGQKDTFEHLETAFQTRFQPKELEKFKYAKELFNERQLPGQSVDEFITQIRKKSTIAGVDNSTLAFIIINALTPNISSYVLENEHDTIEKILQHARVAELTRSSAPSYTEGAVSQQISTLTEQVSRLNQKIAGLSIAVVDDSPMKRQVSFEDVRGRSQSPMHRETRERSGDRERERYPYQRNQYGENRERSNFRHQNDSANKNQQFSRPSFRNYQRPEQNMGNDRSSYRSGPTSVDRQRSTNTCATCGYASHANPLYCSMLNKRCYKCQAVGHGSRVCRASENRRF